MFASLDTLILEGGMCEKVSLLPDGWRVYSEEEDKVFLTKTKRMKCIVKSFTMLWT